MQHDAVKIVCLKQHWRNVRRRIKKFMKHTNMEQIKRLKKWISQREKTGKRGFENYTTWSALVTIFYDKPFQIFSRFALRLKKNEQNIIKIGTAIEYKKKSYTFSWNQISGTFSPSKEFSEKMQQRHKCLSQSKS